MFITALPPCMVLENLSIYIKTHAGFNIYIKKSKLCLIAITATVCIKIINKYIARIIWSH